MRLYEWYNSLSRKAEVLCQRGTNHAPMAGEIAEYLDAVAANYRAPYATSEIRTSYLLWERAGF